MTANGKSRWKISSLLFLKLLWLCVIVLVLVGIVFPHVDTWTIKGNATRDLSNARQLALACKLYANDHKGNFPKKLYDLVPTYIEDAGIFKKLMFLAPEDHSIHEWSYFGSQSVNPPPHTILIASPMPWRNRRGFIFKDDWRRIVVDADTAAEFAREEDFQREIKAQLQSSSIAVPQPTVGK